MDVYVMAARTFDHHADSQYDTEHRDRFKGCNAHEIYELDEFNPRKTNDISSQAPKRENYQFRTGYIVTETDVRIMERTGNEYI